MMLRITNIKDNSGSGKINGINNGEIPLKNPATLMKPWGYIAGWVSNSSTKVSSQKMSSSFFI